MCVKEQEREILRSVSRKLLVGVICTGHDHAHLGHMILPVHPKGLGQHSHNFAGLTCFLVLEEVMGRYLTQWSQSGSLLKT
jgi:hypothetical protein